jgi:hypothetical protein
VCVLRSTASSRDLYWRIQQRTIISLYRRPQAHCGVTDEADKGYSVYGVYHGNLKNQKSRGNKWEKRGLKDRDDVVAMTANKCVRADTVRSNTARLRPVTVIILLLYYTAILSLL